jgi:hypothetical protein
MFIFKKVGLLYSTVGCGAAGAAQKCRGSATLVVRKTAVVSSALCLFTYEGKRISILQGQLKAGSTAMIS